MSDFDLCLGHYRMMFPDVAALGAGSPPAAWGAEYARVSESGLSATLMVGVGSDGGSSTAVRNFDQKVLLQALMVRRAELDSDFEDLIMAPPTVRHGRRMGSVVRTR
jgi:hypothetical protein